MGENEKKTKSVKLLTGKRCFVRQSRERPPTARRQDVSLSISAAQDLKMQKENFVKATKLYSLKIKSLVFKSKAITWPSIDSS
jgi:hypothetical protein